MARHYATKKEDVSHSRDSAKRKEQEDSGMIKEDHNNTSNLPREVIMKPWPKTGYGSSMDLDDTIRGIDSQINDDASEMKRHRPREKY